MTGWQTMSVSVWLKETMAPTAMRCLERFERPLTALPSVFVRLRPGTQKGRCQGPQAAAAAPRATSGAHPNPPQTPHTIAGLRRETASTLPQRSTSTVTSTKLTLTKLTKCRYQILDMFLKRSIQPMCVHTFFGRCTDRGRVRCVVSRWSCLGD